MIKKEIAKDLYLIKELKTRALYSAQTNSQAALSPGLPGSPGDNQSQNEILEYYFAFRVSNSSLKEIDFEADFSQSDNVVAIRDSATIDQILDETSNNLGATGGPSNNLFTSMKKPLSRLDQAKPLPLTGGLSTPDQETNTADGGNNNLVFQRQIDMKQQRAFICLLRLDPGWKLKTKFKYTLNNSSIEKQRKKLSEEQNGVGRLRRQIFQFKDSFKRVPF